VIVDLPNTTISKVSKNLVSLREQGGAVALGRVLTLVIETDLAGIEQAIAAANEASRAHPSRVIVLADLNHNNADEARLDAQIRLGGDAGASEVIILRAYGEAASEPESLVTGLLLPDAPVVAWWPQEAPSNASASALGRIASRRITDSATQPDPHAHLHNLSKTYTPGDSDFTWTRLTLWRAQLAVILDQPPYDQVVAAEVTGAVNSPSSELMAAWLELKLQVPVTMHRTERVAGVHGLQSVKLRRTSGDVEIRRTSADVANLIQEGQPSREITLARRNLRDCLIEDLRRLDSDVLFGEVITKGFGPKVNKPELTGPEGQVRTRP